MLLCSEARGFFSFFFSATADCCPLPTSLDVLRAARRLLHPLILLLLTCCVKINQKIYSSMDSLATISASVALLALTFLLAGLFFQPTPSQRKPYASFRAFYPFYLSQHALPTTKLLHCIGTLIVIVFCAARPLLLLALLLGAALGYAAHPLLRGLDSGLPEMALTLGTYVACAHTFTGSWPVTLGLPLCAYGFAWVAHFLIERNKPATFIYPVYSLMGDFVMFAECAGGRHKLIGKGKGETP